METMKQNLWDTLKSHYEKEFTALSVYIRRSEKTQISDLMKQLKNVEKQEQGKLKPIWQEIIKIKADINEIEIK